MGIKFSIKTRIRFNDKEYGNLEEMPADERRKYEEVMRNFSNRQGNIGMLPSGKIAFNGLEYNSIDEMPENVREMYQHVMAMVDKDGDGIPDQLQDGNAGFKLSGWKDGSKEMDTGIAPVVDFKLSIKKLMTRYVVGIALVFLLVQFLEKYYGKGNFSRHMQDFLPLIVIVLFLVIFFARLKKGSRCKFCGAPVTKTSAMTRKTICIRCGREIDV